METCATDEELSDTQEWFHPKVERDDDRRHDWYAGRRTLVLRIVASNETDADLASRFDALRSAWHREYGASSSLTSLTECPSYREIVQLRERALPFIFRDLETKSEPDHWFAALREITQANPVPLSDRGNRRHMVKAWLKWARAKGYVW
jgi:hypothetical protein